MRIIDLFLRRAFVSIAAVTLWLVTIGLLMVGGEGGHVSIRILATVLAAMLGIMKRRRSNWKARHNKQAAPCWKRLALSQLARGPEIAPKS